MITFGNKKMLNDIKHLWVLGFGDSKEYVDFLFWEHIKPENVLVYLQGQQPIGILCTEPATLVLGEHKVKIMYLYAFTVHPDHRGKKIGNQLLQEYDAYLKRENYSASVLTPANEKLFSYYHEEGYSNFFFAKYAEFSKNEILAWNALQEVSLLPQDLDSLSVLRYNYYKKYELPFVEWNTGYLSLVGKDQQLRGGDTFRISLEEQEGYITYRTEEDTVFITEIVCDDKIFKEVMTVLYKKTKKEKYILRLPSISLNSYDNLGKILPFAMIKWYDRGNNYFTEQNAPFITHVMD